MNRSERLREAPLSGLLRFLLLMLVLAALMGGVWAGLNLLGWRFTEASENFARQHGPLMVSGFIGSAISLERAVTLTVFDHASANKRRRFLRWLIPMLSTLGSLLLIWPASAVVGQWVITAASLGMLLMMLRLLDNNPTLFTLLMAFGAGGWAFGNLLWLNNFQYATLFPAWAMFVVLIFTGERFELERIRPTGRWMLAAFYAGGCLITAGALLAPLNSNLAVRSSGLGCLVLALWLLQNDVARRGVGMSGLSRFSALTILASFIWLGLYGVLALRFGLIIDGAINNAMVHSLFLGFAAGIIIAHAPILLPALLGRRAIYWRWLSVVVLGLHFSFALWVISDLAGWQTGWQWGGLMIASLGLAYILLLGYRLWTTRHSD